MTERTSTPATSGSLIYRLHNWCNEVDTKGDVIEQAQELMSEAAEHGRIRNDTASFDRCRFHGERMKQRARPPGDARNGRAVGMICADTAGTVTALNGHPGVRAPAVVVRAHHSQFDIGERK